MTMEDKKNTEDHGKRDPVKFARNAALISGILATVTIGMGIARGV